MPDSSTAFLEPESERVLWHQQRRRAMVFVGLCFLGWLALFSWLLLHPSATGSPARTVKNALFGQRVTEAVERAVAQAGQEGSDQEGSSGQGRERQGRRGQGRDGQGREGQGEEGQGNEGEGRDGQGQSGRAGQRQSGQGAQGGASGDQPGDQDAAGEPGEESSQNAEGGRRGQGTRRRGSANSPANEQHPENNAPDLAAPPERSIGWLDRFFGVQRPDAAVIQAGEGGSGDAPGAGNTNNSAVASTNPIAAEFTQDAPPSERPELTRPPQPRNTNLPAIAATNATINDRMEQLLTQHRAGRGDLRISLMWQNKNDLDLHVVDPNGEEIYYSHRTARSGGLLDIDMNASPPLVSPAVENVYWPERGAPSGAYKIFVNYYRRQESSINQTPFMVRLLIKGRTTDFSGVASFGERKKLVHQFTLAPASASPRPAPPSPPPPPPDSRTT